MPSRRSVEACRRGEREAQHAFYEKYRRRVFSLIARIVGAQDAEELVAGGLLARLRGLEKFRGDAQLVDVDVSAGGQRRLVVRDARRRRGRSAISARTRSWRCRREDAPATDPRLRARLERALRALPAAIARCWCCTTSRGCSTRRSRDILGCRVGTSKSQLHKARAKMRELLGGAP